MKQCIAILFTMILAFNLQSCKADTEEAPKPTKHTFRRDAMLEIHAPSGELKAAFEIEIAQTEAALMQGLKYREQMEENQGMLFIFENIDFHSFWMQDTYLSLDMIFIDHNGAIVSIAKNTTPFSEEQIFPEKANKYVLEVLAGTADKYKLKELDIVTWKKD